MKKTGAGDAMASGRWDWVKFRKVFDAMTWRLPKSIRSRVERMMEAEDTSLLEEIYGDDYERAIADYTMKSIQDYVSDLWNRVHYEGDSLTLEELEGALEVIDESVYVYRHNILPYI